MRAILARFSGRSLIQSINQNTGSLQELAAQLRSLREAR